MSEVIKLRRCTCMEVHGEDPDCILHGVETDWALENTSPHDWQNMVLEYREQIAAMLAASKEPKP